MRLLLIILAVLAMNLPARAQEADPALVAAAQKEGKVMLYGEVITPTERALKAAFEKKYPGITMDLLYLSGAPMMNRVMSEQDAERYVVDTLMLDSLRLPLLLEKGYLAKYESTQSEHFAARWHSEPRGYWIQNHSYGIGVMYNKSQVPADQLPHTYDDLLKPQWAGKIALVTPVANDLMLYFFAGLVRDLGEDKAFQLFRGWAAQKPLIFGPGGMRVSQGVANGEFQLGIGFVGHVFTVGGGEDGPMGVAPVNPVYLGSGPGVAVMTHAPHPNAARLLADFLNSRESMEIIASVGYAVSYTGIGMSKAMGGVITTPAPPLVGEPAEALRKKLIDVFGN